MFTISITEVIDELYTTKKNIILDEIKVKKSISWIKNQQNNNGAYTTVNDLVSPEQSTSEALSTFHALELIFDKSQAKALTFLNMSSDENTEFIARRIIANAEQGNDNSSLVLQLKTYQNQNGGFGFIQGFDSFTLDTAWALKALAADGQARSSEANRAITWIVSQQHVVGVSRDTFYHYQQVVEQGDIDSLIAKS